MTCDLAEVDEALDDGLYNSGEESDDDGEDSNQGGGALTATLRQFREQSSKVPQPVTLLSKHRATQHAFSLVAFGARASVSTLVACVVLPGQMTPHTM